MKTSLPGNPHYKVLTNTGYTTETPEFAATCQVEATLVLAYEQRTANLIAYAAHLGQTSNHSAMKLLEDEVDARLGLNGDDS